MHKLIAPTAYCSNEMMFAALITQYFPKFIDNSGDDVISQGPAMPQFIHHFFLGDDPLVIFNQQQQGIEHLGLKFNVQSIFHQTEGTFVEPKWTEFKLLHGLILLCGV